jgi:glyceraldehyde 3-phosphate dehydrogenase
MTARVAIHGFGRTGRQAFKAIWQHHRHELEVAAIGLTELKNAAAAAHLLTHDSNYGRFDVPTRVVDGQLHVGPESIPIVAAPEPAELPWGRLGVDIVIDATGVNEERERAAGHLAAGARKVIVTAPSEDADFTLIYGVNEGRYDPRRHDVISAGSDTTNALAPMLVALDGFEIRSAFVTAVRAYTNAQKLIDAADPDLRRARSAPTSIVPTTTRSAATIGRVLPEMAGRISGYAVCVPVATVSILELTAQLAAAVPAAELNDAFRQAAEGRLGQVLATSDEQLVSTDYRGSRFSAVVDLPLTMTIGPLAKISAWYDNEWGYSCRLADVAAVLADRH